TAGTYIWLPTMPLLPGCVPVAIAAALTRVTVGNTAWLSVNRTPSVASRKSVGVSSAVIASGRSPSTTKTITKREPVVMGCSERAHLSARVRAETILDRAGGDELLQQARRERHVAGQRRLVAEQTVTRQVQLQRLRGDRVVARERPVATSCA